MNPEVRFAVQYHYWLSAHLIFSCINSDFSCIISIFYYFPHSFKLAIAFLVSCHVFFFLSFLWIVSFLSLFSPRSLLCSTKVMSSCTLLRIRDDFLRISGECSLVLTEAVCRPGGHSPSSKIGSVLAFSGTGSTGLCPSLTRGTG